MARLVVNPGSEGAWEIQLKPGANFIGRGFSNDFKVNDPSISGSHCQISVAGESIIIKDLGSTNGTFVNQSQIQDVELKDGQMVRLGKVEMLFYSGGAAPAQAPRVPVVRMTGGRARVATLVAAPASSTASIPPLPPPLPRPAVVPIRRQSLPHEIPSFFSVVWTAFGYPFQGDGVLLLITGTVFFSILNAAKFFAAFAGLIGLVAIMILMVIGTGYLTCYLRRIITGTSVGEAKMPDWPDVSDIGSDIVSPFLQFLGTLLASFLPAIIVTWYFAAENGGPSWVLLLAVGFGAVYFPMAFLAVAMLDTVVAVNPLVVVPPILRMPLAYFFACALFFVAFLLRWQGVIFLHHYVPVKLVSAVLIGFAELYFLAVGVRVLGLLYWTNKEKFGWLSH